MRKYKQYTIPDRHPRVLEDVEYKQNHYCDKSNCIGIPIPLPCKECLFDKRNIDAFKEWYINKNKPLKVNK